MLTVDDYRTIRIAHRDGLSIRAIARTLRHSRRKVRQALARAEPRPYARHMAPAYPKLGTLVGILEQILADDVQAPRKQRHTAMQMYRRLVAEHGYQGGYDAVRRCIGKMRKTSRPTFIPLEHPPGQRLEADFGHIHVDYPDDRRQVAVLLLTWSYSHAVFAMKLPTERVESILLGIDEGLKFFGCGPLELWWDNPTTVATQILKGRQRRVNERYAALASHYRFEPMFCMPASGWEKPDVENRVYDLQRRWATPVPRVADDDELNAHLLSYCQAEWVRIVRGQTQTIGQMFEEDKAAAVALPSAGAPGFDACVFANAAVDHYQTVRYDKSRYSVPRSCPRRSDRLVTIKAYAHEIAIVDDHHVVARHRRRYDGGWQLDPLHYLITLARRPMALDHANIYRNWRLPESFHQLRARLEARHGTTGGAGVRHYIQVLQLLADHPLTRVEQAVAAALAGAEPMLDGPSITQYAQQLAQSNDGDASVNVAAADDLPRHMATITVPEPDLARFNQLLTPVDSTHPSQGDAPHA